MVINGCSALGGQRPGLSFRYVSQDWIISFFWCCTWWSLTMISSDWRSQIFEKQNLVAQIGPNGPKSGPKWGFLLFSWVWIILFPWNCINDNLLQWLTSSRGKTHEKKNWGPKFGSDLPRLGPKLGFSPFSQVWFIIFSLNCIVW